MELKTIKVSLKSWEKFMKLRIDLGYKNSAELFEKILSKISMDDLRKK